MYVAALSGTLVRGYQKKKEKQHETTSSCTGDYSKRR
jgi:hypothetical protein